MKLVFGEGYIPCEVGEATHVQLHCPGPFPNRFIPIGAGGWEWNRNVDRPTLTPSILSSGGGPVCHSFVNDGKIQFLTDCTHEFAGQTLDLLEVD